MNSEQRSQFDIAEYNKRVTQFGHYSKNASNAFRAFFIATAIGYSTIAATVEDFEFNRWNGLIILLVSGILDFVQFSSTAGKAIVDLIKNGVKKNSSESVDSATACKAIVDLIKTRARENSSESVDFQKTPKPSKDIGGVEGLGCFQVGVMSLFITKLPLFMVSAILIWINIYQELGK